MAAITVIAVTIIGGHRLIVMTESPEFCRGCHIMEPQYRAWFASGAHRAIKCVDCHLPNDNIISHLVWKSIDGAKDSYAFYIRQAVEAEAASERTKHTVMDNCVRCHEQLVSNIGKKDMLCWSCHRRQIHRLGEVR